MVRQYWTDQRLSFNSNVIDELTMNWQVGKITSIGQKVAKKVDTRPNKNCKLNKFQVDFVFVTLQIAILQFLYKIWTPDTYFLNGRDSYLHKIAVPNR